MKIEVCCGMKIRISSWLENRFKIVGRCKIDIYGWTGSSVAMLGWQPDPAWQARYLPVMSDNTNLISSTTDNSCVGSIMLLKSSMINIPNSEQSDLSECALYLNLIITVIPEETLQHFVNIEHELEVVVIMTGEQVVTQSPGWSQRRQCWLRLRCPRSQLMSHSSVTIASGRVRQTLCYVDMWVTRGNCGALTRNQR